jgi:hypothetical protein
VKMNGTELIQDGVQWQAFVTMMNGQIPYKNTVKLG